MKRQGRPEHPGVGNSIHGGMRYGLDGQFDCRTSKW